MKDRILERQIIVSEKQMELRKILLVFWRQETSLFFSFSYISIQKIEILRRCQMAIYTICYQNNFGILFN